METKELEVKTQKGLELTENGTFALSNMEDQKNYASYLIAQGLVSDTFKKPSQLIQSIQMAKDLGLPMSCLKDFYVIGGRPAIYGDTFVALALGSGLISEHKVVFFDEEGNELKRPKKGSSIFGCEVSIKRKGSSEFVTAFYTLDDKEKAKASNPNWYKFPTDMLFRRAMTRAIKFACADAVRGIEIADYAEEANYKETEKEKAQEATRVFNDVIID